MPRSCALLLESGRLAALAYTLELPERAEPIEAWKSGKLNRRQKQS